MSDRAGDKSAGVSSGFMAIERGGAGDRHLIKTAFSAPLLLVMSQSQRRQAMIDFDDLRREYVSSEIMRRVMFHNTSTVEMMKGGHKLAVRTRFLKDFRVLSPLTPIRRELEDVKRGVDQYFRGYGTYTMRQFVNMCMSPENGIRFDEFLRNIEPLINPKDFPGLLSQFVSLDYTGEVDDLLNKLTHASEIIKQEVLLESVKKKHGSGPAKPIKGFGKAIIGALYIDNWDWHPENMGLFFNPSSQETEFAIIDHGRSLIGGADTRTGAALLQKISDQLNDFYSKEIDISLEEMREGIRGVAQISDEEIEGIVERRLWTLKASGMVIDVEAEKKNMLSVLHKQRESLINLDKVLYNIHCKALVTYDKDELEPFLQGDWMQKVRQDAKNIERLSTLSKAEQRKLSKLSSKTLPPIPAPQDATPVKKKRRMIGKLIAPMRRLFGKTAVPASDKGTVTKAPKLAKYSPERSEVAFSELVEKIGNARMYEIRPGCSTTIVINGNPESETFYIDTRKESRGTYTEGRKKVSDQCNLTELLAKHSKKGGTVVLTSHGDKDRETGEDIELTINKGNVNIITELLAKGWSVGEIYDIDVDELTLNKEQQNMLGCLDTMIDALVSSDETINYGDALVVSQSIIRELMPHPKLLSQMLKEAKASTVDGAPPTKLISDIAKGLSGAQNIALEARETALETFGKNVATFLCSDQSPFRPQGGGRAC